MKIQKKAIQVFLAAIGITFFSFGFATYSIDKATNEDPQLLSKIETQIRSRPQFKNFHFNISKDSNSAEYEESTQWASFPANIRFLNINAIAADIEFVAGGDDAIELTAKGLANKTGKKRSELLDISFDENEILISEFGFDEVKNIHIQILIPKKYRNTLKVKTVSGDITIKPLELEMAELYSVSGDLNIESDADSNLMIGTVSGDVKLHFTKPTNNLRFEISSVSGDISNNLKSDPNGAHAIKIHTVSGDITLQ